MKQNLYENNFATGGVGLVDIRGVSRLNFNLETYTSNGDAHKELIDKFKSLNMMFGQYFQN